MLQTSSAELTYLAVGGYALYAAIILGTYMERHF